MEMELHINIVSLLSISPFLFLSTSFSTFSLPVLFKTDLYLLGTIWLAPEVSVHFLVLEIGVSVNHHSQNSEDTTRITDLF